MALKAGLDLDASRFRAELERASKSATQTIGRMAAGIGSALAGAFSVGKIIEWGNELDRVGKLAARFGTSAESMQRIGAAAGESGVALDLVARQMARLNGELAKGGPSGREMSSILEQLGISVSDFLKMPMDKQLIALAEGLEKAKGQGTDLTNVYALLGTKGVEMTNLLGQGATKLKEVMGSASVVSDKAVANIQRANDTAARLSNTVKAFLFNALMKAFEGAVALYGILGRIIERLGEMALVESMRETGRNMVQGAMEEFERINAPEKRETVAIVDERAVRAERERQFQQQERESKEQLEKEMRDRNQKIRALQKQMRDLDEQDRIDKLPLAKRAAAMRHRVEVELRKAQELFYQNPIESLEKQISLRKDQREAEEATRAAEAEARMRREARENKMAQVQRSLSQAKVELQDLQSALSNATRERLTMSLGEMAAGHGGSRRKAQAANVARLEKQAQKLFMAGQEERGLEMLSRADQLRGKIKGLSEADVNPMKGIEDRVTEQLKVIEGINTTLETLQSAIAD